MSAENKSVFNLSTGNQIVVAHKLILSTCSPVFKAMFSNNMRESTENILKITDINSKAIYEFVKYIYTGTIENLDEYAIDLLNAAEK